jgi:ribonuclease P protein component
MWFFCYLKKGVILIKKYETVKRKEEFNDIIKTCHFLKNKYFIIYIKKNEYNFNRFGIAISKKVGNAVTRNKLKRQVRAIINNIKTSFPKSYDYIIMIKKECNIANFQEKQEKLIELTKEIK